MGVTVEIVDAARRAPGASWDEFVRAQDLPGVWHGEPLHAYARASTDGVYLARVELDGAVVALGSFRGALGSHGRRYRDITAPTRAVLLRCSVPVSFSAGFVLARGLDERERDWLMAEMHAAVRARFRPWCRAIFYENVEPRDRQLFRQRHIAIHKSPVALLKMAWSSFDDYLGELPRGRRRRFARLVSDIATDSSIVATDLGTEIDPVEASRLDLITRMRHLPARAPAAPLPTGYFDAALATGRAGVFSFAVPDRRLLRFDLVFPTRDTFVTTVTGGEQGPGPDLYSALFLREIGFAIARGTPMCEFGPGALREKLRFGCTLEDRYAFLAV